MMWVTCSLPSPDLRRNVGRIVLDSADEPGLSLVKPWESDEVEAWHCGDSPLMDRRPLLVQHRQRIHEKSPLNPLKPRTPNDGADSRFRQIYPSRSIRGLKVRPRLVCGVVLRRPRCKLLRFYVGVDVVFDVGRFVVGESDVLAEACHPESAMVLQRQRGARPP